MLTNENGLGRSFGGGTVAKYVRAICNIRDLLPTTANVCTVTVDLSIAQEITSKLS